MNLRSFLLIMVAIVYFVAPDLLPGPIDDVIVAVLCFTGAARQKVDA